MKTIGILISSYLLVCAGIAQAGSTVSSGDDSRKYFECNTPPNVDSSYRIRAFEPKINLSNTQMHYEINGNVTVLEAAFTETRPNGKSLILTFATREGHSLIIDATALERNAPVAFVTGWYRSLNSEQEVVSSDVLVCQYVEPL